MSEETSAAPATIPVASGPPAPPVVALAAPSAAPNVASQGGTRWTLEQEFALIRSHCLWRAAGAGTNIDPWILASRFVGRRPSACRQRFDILMRGWKENGLDEMPKKEDIPASHRAPPKTSGKRTVSVSAAGQEDAKKRKIGERAADVSPFVDLASADDGSTAATTRANSPAVPKPRATRKKPGFVESVESSSDDLEDDDVEYDDVEDDYLEYDDVEEDDDAEEHNYDVEDEDAEMDDAPADDAQPTNPKIDYTDTEFPHITGPSPLKDWLNTEMLVHVKPAPHPKMLQNSNNNNND